MILQWCNELLMVTPNPNIFGETFKLCSFIVYKGVGLLFSCWHISLLPFVLDKTLFVNPLSYIKHYLLILCWWDYKQWYNYYKVKEILPCISSYLLKQAKRRKTCFQNLCKINIFCTVMKEPICSCSVAGINITRIG